MHSADIPEPAPEIIMAANGIYWRRYEDSLSMVPTSDDNDPVLTPYAVYRLVGREDHEGTFTPVEPPTGVSMGLVAKVATVAEQMRRRAENAEAEADRYRDALEKITQLVRGALAANPEDEVCPRCGAEMLLHGDSDHLGPCSICPETEVPS